MATTALCTSFKVEILKGEHVIKASGGHTIKVALYNASSTNGAGTTAYTATNEMSGTNYSAGGTTLTVVDPTSSGTTAFCDFADVTWGTSTITSAASCMIYNDTHAGNASISVHDFGGLYSSSGGDFTLVFPTPNSTTAIIRLA